MALFIIDRECIRHLVDYHEQFQILLTLTKGKRIAQAQTRCVEHLDKGFQKLSRVSRLLVYSIHMARLRINLD